MITYHVDGGMFLGPGRVRKGVYWSVKRVLPKPDVILRCQDMTGQYLTNNDAEWLALREALRHVTEHHAGAPVTVYSDSLIVVNQFRGEWKSRVARLHRLRTECLALAALCASVTVTWVPREVSLEQLGH